MKKLSILILIFSSINVFSQSDLTQNYYYSLMLLNNNEADQIIMGNISLLNDKYPLQVLSLAKLTKNELRLLRNTIYAKYGYIFQSKDLVDYFTQFSWYKPQINDVDKKITKVDKLNINMIQEFEKKDKTINTVKWDKKKVGVWQNGYGFAAGWSDRFVIYNDNKIEFLYSQMGELKQIYGLYGTYTITGNVLDFIINKIEFCQLDLEVEFSGAFGYEWKESSDNSLTFEKPIILSFPISDIQLDTKDNKEVLTLEIGGNNFYLMETDVNKKY